VLTIALKEGGSDNFGVRLEIVFLKAMLELGPVPLHSYLTWKSILYSTIQAMDSHS